MPRASSCAIWVITALCAIASACSASSSESPWPVEPNEIESGPEGEDHRRGAAAGKSKPAVDELDDYGGSGGGRPARRRTAAEPDPSERGLAP